MTFLAPVAGLVAAALAVPVLLLFYFLKLRRRQVRVSSTLLWSHAMQDLQVNTPFRWLRASVLLFLQLAALLLLATAVARPAMRDEGPGGSRVVIVIDRSASMNATDGAGGEAGAATTRLDEAKRRAEEMLTRLSRRSGGWGFGGGGGGGWQACVVTFASRAEALTGFTSDVGALREAVRSITPTDQPGDFPALVRFVDALAGAAPEEQAATERTGVHVFSDGWFGAGVAGAPLPPPRGVDARLERVGPAPAEDAAAVASYDNIGIVSISARREYEDPALVRVFVRLVNAGAGSQETVVQLRVGDGAGELADARVVTVPGVGEGGVAGEASVTFEIENTVGGLVIASLGRRDILAADDAAALVLSPAGRARVLLVAPGENGEGADTYLSSVLEAMELRDFRVVGKGLYEEMIVMSEAPGGAPVGGEAPDLRDWDLAVFDRVRPERAPPASLASVSFGAGLPIPGVSVGAVEGRSGTSRVVSWQRTHPLLRYVSLDALLIAPPVRLTLPAGGEGAGGGAEAVAWGEDGPIIGVIEGAGAGGSATRRAMVAFEVAQSNWGPDVSFPVFLSNAVEYLTMRGQATAGRFVRTSEPVQATPAKGVSEVVLEGPARLTAAVRAAPAGEQASGLVSFGQVEGAGVYRLIGSAAGPQVVAVNLADETETLARTAAELPLAGVSRMAEAARVESVREVWHWFAAAALLLLVTEWFVQAWKMRT